MSEKILMNISNNALKKIFMMTIVQMGYDFVEYTNSEDLRFKLALVQQSTFLIIHELNYNSYKKEFEFIEDLVRKNIKVLVYTDHYDAKAIDDAIRVGACDMLHNPVTEDILRSKIENLAQENSKQETPLEEERDLSLIDLEIARANRGNYSLSFVMAELSGVFEEDVPWFLEVLRNHLRETDLIFQWSHNRFVLICPFTLKANIVEVENKIRVCFKESYMRFRNKVTLYLYGIAYPMDGDNTHDIINGLKNGLYNSYVLGNIKGGFNNIAKSEIEYYRRIFRKKQD